METTTFFKSENNNNYLYDVEHKAILNIHPVLWKIHEWKKIGQDKELFELLRKDFPDLSEEDIHYYCFKYKYLKQQGFFKRYDLGKTLQGQVEVSAVEHAVANCNNVVFQVTHECNLNCVYCCYGDLYENITNEEAHKVMSFSQAKVVLDYLIPYWNSDLNLSYDNMIMIGFYGGEPLVNFSLIRQIITYLRSVKLKNGTNIKYSMTTNGVLLNKYMDFLVENDVFLLISLDGDKCHNFLRVDKNNQESFERVYNNIKKLQLQYPEYFKERVEFNSVLNSHSSGEAVYTFIYNEFGKRPSIESISGLGLKKDKIEEYKKIYQPYVETKKMRQGKKGHSGAVRDAGYFFYYHLTNSYRHYSELILMPAKRKRIPTGTCLPFFKKIFITPTGKILACERIGKEYVLGRVEETVKLDFEEVAQFYNKYFSIMSKQCSRCYYAEFCSACLFQLPQKKGKPVCPSMYNKADLEKYLSDQVTFLENNTEDFDKINKIVFA